MDQVKIGKYIAAKRKALGMTQVQLADQLGMSDKSVSKWERGVCLPDVSVYTDLCAALGISLNEFLAGEDIEHENIEKKAEENIMTVSRDSKKRSRKLRRIAAILAAALLLLCTGAAWFLHSEGYFAGNYLKGYDMDSDLYRTVSQLSIPETPYLYEFNADNSYSSAIFRFYEYDHGELTASSAALEANLLTVDENGRTPRHTQGTVAVLRHGSDFSLIVATEDSVARVDTEPDKDLGAFMAMTETGCPDARDIAAGEEYPLCAFYYGDTELTGFLPEEAFTDPAGTLADTEYTLLITVEFGTEER